MCASLAISISFFYKRFPFNRKSEQMKCEPQMRVHRADSDHESALNGFCVCEWPNRLNRTCETRLPMACSMLKVRSDRNGGIVFAQEFRQLTEIILSFCRLTRIKQEILFF